MRQADAVLNTAGPDAATARVLAHLDDHAADIVADLAALVRVPSVSGSVEECTIQEILAARCDAAGLEVDRWPIPIASLAAEPGFPGVEVDREEAWGLVARLPGRDGGRSLMLDAHVDVVPAGPKASWSADDPFSGQVTAGAVYGRGACDMKGGLVAALWAVHALAACDVSLAGDVLLALVPGEEDGGLGTYATLRRGWHADACVIPEPTSLDLAPASAGSLTFRLTVTGLATHASRRTEGVSAVDKFLPVLAAVRELERERNVERDPLMERWAVPYPIEIGRVAAGDWASSVPGELVADGRYGVRLDEDVADARAAFEDAIAEGCAADPWLRGQPVRITWWGGEFAPGRTAPDADIVATLRRAHNRVSRHPQRTWGTPYGSDLRLLTGLGGIPTVHYGPGDAGLAHAPDERVPVAEVLTAAHALALTAISFSGPDAVRSP